MASGESHIDTTAGIDPLTFRSILGHFPTGVAVITSTADSGDPVGMAVGSFTSVSLDPPLVAFLVDRDSTSFPRFSSSRNFCVNVLSSDQLEICRIFAKSGGDKFRDVRWTPSRLSKSPQIVDALAWIDCTTEDIHAAGDHHIVIGKVNSLGHASSGLPLLFYKGGYGVFSTL